MNTPGFTRNVALKGTPPADDSAAVVISTVAGVEGMFTRPISTPFTYATQPSAQVTVTNAVMPAVFVVATLNWDL